MMDKQVGTDQHQIVKMNLTQIQVCSLGTEEEALEWVRGAAPAGTSANWQKNVWAEFKPVTCALDTGRTHYMFEA